MREEIIKLFDELTSAHYFSGINSQIDTQYTLVNLRQVDGMKDKGEVYVLANKCMPTFYKIGISRTGINERIRSLRSTSVPFDFECVHSISSDHCLQLERHLHRCFSDVRANGVREFFVFPDNYSAIGQIQEACTSFEPRPYTEADAKALQIERRETASDAAKAAGLKSLLEVSRMTGVSFQTLNNWHNNKPKLFAMVIAGCAATKNNPEK